jgi:hypothetical protein
VNAEVSASLSCHNVGKHTAQRNLSQFFGSVASQNELQNVKRTASKCEKMSQKMASILYKLKL